MTVKARPVIKGCNKGGSYSTNKSCGWFIKLYDQPSTSQQSLLDFVAMCGNQVNALNNASKVHNQTKIYFDLNGS